MFSQITLFLVLSSAAIVICSPLSAPKKTIPWKACRKSDPQFNQCLQAQVQQAIPALTDGYPKFRIPPIDPFDLSQLSIAKGQGAVAVDLSLQNVKIYGLSSAIVEALEVDVPNLKSHIRLRFSKPIDLLGQYTAKGKVQLFPINGKGPCNITFVNPVLDIFDIVGETVVRNGQEFIDLKTLNLQAIKVDKIILKLDNLIQGNKELSENLNVFLNENWTLLFEELKPAFEEAIAVIVKGIVSNSLKKIAKADVFPN